MVAETLKKESICTEIAAEPGQVTLRCDHPVRLGGQAAPTTEVTSFGLIHASMVRIEVPKESANFSACSEWLHRLNKEAPDGWRGTIDFNRKEGILHLQLKNPEVILDGWCFQGTEDAPLSALFWARDEWLGVPRCQAGRCRGTFHTIIEGPVATAAAVACTMASHGRLSREGFRKTIELTRAEIIEEINLAEDRLSKIGQGSRIRFRQYAERALDRNRLHVMFAYRCRR